MPDAPHDFVDTLRRFVTHRLTRLAASWIACLVVATSLWVHAYHCFDSPRTNENSSAAELDNAREDRNNGHTWIDFGGQYVFGRTAVEGNWRSLYDRNTLRRTAQAAYPIEVQSPGVQKYHDQPERRPDYLKEGEVRSDAERLLRSMMGDEEERRQFGKVCEVVGVAFAGGSDNPIAAAACATKADRIVEDDQNSDSPALGQRNLGGPLYPPVHAIFYAPLGLIPDSQLAYRLFQLFGLVCVFGSGLAVRVLTNGRIWWPVATLLLLLMPGMRPGIDLGQNQSVTLLIVLTGWAVAARYTQFGGGMVWGLLAFKPVWGLAFILTPILLRKWKFVAGTAVSGIAICLATLPLVGVQGWLDWLAVGRGAADLYNVDENWINLSRDVSGIPKRVFLDFSKPRHEVGDESVNLLSNLLLVGIASVTVLVGTFGGETLPRAWRIARTRGFGAAVADFLSGRTTSFVGLRAGFLLLGGWLSCYRFMYYDSVLISVGLTALLAYPRWQFTGWRGELTVPNQPPGARRTLLFVNSFPVTMLVLILLADTAILYCGQNVTLSNDHIRKQVPDTAVTVTTKADGGTAATEHGTKWVARSLKWESGYNYAVETLLTLGLWAWCGWQLVRHGDRERFPPPEV